MKLGMHVLTKAHDQFYGLPTSEPARSQHVAVWRQMGITDLKLVTDGDSQLKSAKWLVEQGFTVLVRFYAEPVNTSAVPDDQLKLFRDVGVTMFEGYTNEPEIEWKRPPTPDVIDELARQHIRFADACGRCLVVPLTPAIQGDRVYSWFEPMVLRIKELGRADALMGSFIACHPRPVNNLPDTPPPGFVPRSYELFDAVMRKHFNTSRPIYATEWGYEPGDSDNGELPPITLASHAEYNVQLAQAKRPDYLKVAYYWTWLNDWFASGWWRGDVAGSLPVVKAFIDMPKPAKTYTDAELAAFIKAQPSQVSLNPAAALFKAGNAAALGWPETSEWEADGWVYQKYQKGGVACKKGDWGNVRVVRWQP